MTFAAEATVRPETILDRPTAKRLDVSTQFALIAALEAWADAGAPDVVTERLGVDFATGIGGVWTPPNAWDTLREKGPRRVMPMTVPMLMPNASAGFLSLHFGARAFARTVASACASSVESLDSAYHHLQAGDADIVIAGGASCHPPDHRGLVQLDAGAPPVATSTHPRPPRAPGTSIATASSWARRWR